MYKVVTKIIANRIKPFLLDLIRPQQTHFLKGRRACDNAVLVQEIYNHVNKTTAKAGSFMLKLDLEKAFDHLEWSFEYGIFRFFKFPKNITSLIMSCITTSSISILVNGFHTSFFEVNPTFIHDQGIITLKMGENQANLGLKSSPQAIWVLGNREYRC